MRPLGVTDDNSGQAPISGRGPGSQNPARWIRKRDDRLLPSPPTPLPAGEGSTVTRAGLRSPGSRQIRGEFGTVTCFRPAPGSRNPARWIRKRDDRLLPSPPTPLPAGEGSTVTRAELRSPGSNNDSRRPAVNGAVERAGATLRRSVQRGRAGSTIARWRRATQRDHRAA